MVHRHGFWNAFTVRVRRINLPARIEFDERQEIGRVAVHFVGGHVNEYRLWTVAPRSFKQHRGSVRVHGEIGRRIGCRPVVRGLRCRVNNEIYLIAASAKDPDDLIGVAYVNLAVDIVAVLACEAFANPSRRGLGAEEVAAHVVVDANHVPALSGVIGRCLRSDQTGRAGDDC